VLDWSTQQLQKVDADIATDEDRTEFAAVVRRQFGPVYALWAVREGRAIRSQQLRGTLFEMLGAASDPAVLAEAQQLTARVFAVDNKAGQDTDATLIRFGVLVSARSGDAALYDQAACPQQNLRRPRREDRCPANAWEIPRSCTGLAHARLPCLRRGAEPGHVDCAGRAAADRATRDQTWDYMQKNWDKVHAQLTVSSGAEVVRATGNFCTAARRGRGDQPLRDGIRSKPPNARSRRPWIVSTIASSCARARSLILNMAAVSAEVDLDG